MIGFSPVITTGIRKESYCLSSECRSIIFHSVYNQVLHLFPASRRWLSMRQITWIQIVRLRNADSPILIQVASIWLQWRDKSLQCARSNKQHGSNNLNGDTGQRSFEKMIGCNGTFLCHLSQNHGETSHYRVVSKGYQAEEIFSLHDFGLWRGYA